MKIAVVHNFLDNIGGAEMVTLQLAEHLKADVYACVVDYTRIKAMGFDINVNTIGWIPRNPPLRQQMAYWRMRRLNLSGRYDFFIIAGDWAFAAAYHNKPNLWYIHSPARELWDLYDYTRDRLVPFYGRPAFDAWVGYNRSLMKEALPHVTKLACNSRNTGARQA